MRQDVWWTCAMVGGPHDGVTREAKEPLPNVWHFPKRAPWSWSNPPPLEACIERHVYKFRARTSLAHDLRVAIYEYQGVG